jgi:hypothetical protein
MLRQRVRVRTSPVAIIGRVVLIIFSLALIWYGLMLILLALKVSPHTVNQISGYRTAYNYLSERTATDITSTIRLIAGLAGVAAFLLFGYVAWKSLPRPYLARTDLRLLDDERGVVDVAPRAIERAIEGAALDRDAVQHAAARYGGDEVTVNLTVTRARELSETMHAVRAKAHEELGNHGLPEVPVNITLTSFERTQRRELA